MIRASLLAVAAMLAGCVSGKSTDFEAWGPATTLAQQPQQPGRSTLVGDTARVQFKCPLKGTIVEYQSGVTIQHVTFSGSDPSNSDICVSTSSRGVNTVLFGIYPTTINADLAAISRGFLALFEGSQAEFVVQVSDTKQSTLYEDRWIRLGRETLTIAGVNVDTIAFGRRQKGQSGNNFVGSEKRWYDPVSGLWLKREVRLQGGRWGNEWEVTRYIVPN